MAVDIIVIFIIINKNSDIGACIKSSPRNHDTHADVETAVGCINSFTLEQSCKNQHSFSVLVDDSKFRSTKISDSDDVSVGYDPCVDNTRKTMVAIDEALFVPKDQFVRPGAPENLRRQERALESHPTTNTTDRRWDLCAGSDDPPIPIVQEVVHLGPATVADYNHEKTKPPTMQDEDADKRQFLRWLIFVCLLLILGLLLGVLVRLKQRDDTIPKPQRVPHSGNRSDKIDARGWH